MRAQQFDWFSIHRNGQSSCVADEKRHCTGNENFGMAAEVANGKVYIAGGPNVYAFRLP
jgi:hypothetical protein